MSRPTQQLGIESVLWETANSLRGSVSSSDYKHVVLGLLFLKYLFDGEKGAINQKHFPKSGGLSWSDVVVAAKSNKPSKSIDEIIGKLELLNPELAQTFPRFSQFEGLAPNALNRLIESLTPIDLAAAKENGKDILSRTYEYFLTKFAASEGRLGGEFYTPMSIVSLMVDLLQPVSGNVYDPACGTGGLFIQAKASAESKGENFDSIKVIGQETNPMTWRLAKLNLALHGLNFDLGGEWGDTFGRDQHTNLRADFILTNPPFGKGTVWPRNELALDDRWEFGLPPESPSNYAWLQHYIARLNSNGVAVAVMPNGTLTSRGIEGQIRAGMVQADVVECVISLPGQLFYSTPIPVCLWILNRNKKAATNRRNRQSEILLIDGRNLGLMTSKIHRTLSAPDIKRMVDAYHSWQGRDTQLLELDKAFATSVRIEDVAAKDYSLNPSEYVINTVEIKPKEVVAVSRELIKEAIAAGDEFVTRQKRIKTKELSSLLELVPANKGGREWQPVKVRDVARVVGGGTPDTKNSNFFGGDIPWITPRDMARHRGREIYNGERSLTREGLDSCGTTLIPQGAVLISSRAPIGLIALAGVSLGTNQGVRSLVLHEGQDPHFWFYLMKSSLKKLDAAGNGTTFRELRGSTLSEMTFTVPGLETQRAIAAYLSEMENASERARKTSHLLDDFLSVVTPGLISGRLKVGS